MLLHKNHSKNYAVNEKMLQILVLELASFQLLDNHGGNKSPSSALTFRRRICVNNGLRWSYITTQHESYVVSGQHFYYVITMSPFLSNFSKLTFPHIERLKIHCNLRRWFSARCVSNPNRFHIKLEKTTDNNSEYNIM